MKNNTGYTLVEILIAIVVVSMVLILPVVIWLAVHFVRKVW